MMTAGRLVGDRLAQRFRAVTLARAGGAPASVGLALCLLLDRAAAGVAGPVVIGWPSQLAGLAWALALPALLAAFVAAAAGAWHRGDAACHGMSGNDARKLWPDRCPKSPGCS